MKNKVIYTSYFANLRKLPFDLTPISISIYPPKGWKGLEYKVLAPSASILAEWKRDGDCKKYIDRYHEDILSKLDPQKIVSDLYQLAGEDKRIVLVCYEKSTDFCHRHLVAEWLEKHGFSVAEIEVSK